MGPFFIVTRKKSNTLIARCPIYVLEKMVQKTKLASFGNFRLFETNRLF